MGSTVSKSTDDKIEVKILVTKLVIDSVVEVNFLSENMHKFQFILMVDVLRRIGIHLLISLLISAGTLQRHMSFVLIPNKIFQSGFFSRESVSRIVDPSWRR